MNQTPKKIQPVLLADFLAQSNAELIEPLPLVHSTSAARIFDIFETEKLLATPCNVFRGENLCYLFVGRPAYKADPIEHPSEWQLPVVFVVRGERLPKFKRVFPFDSGAFQRSILPDFITCFKLDRYNVVGGSDNIGRIISIYFRSARSYWKRKPVGEEAMKDRHILGPRHREILALARLYAKESTRMLDDRAATIEVQIDADVALNSDNLVGIVMPKEYARDRELVESIAHMTPQIETYDIFPLSSEAYYGMIYDAVNRIYRKAKIKFD